MKKRAILYKYRSWKKEEDRKTLTQNEFYLASPRDFNDPFDCRISPNLSLLDSKEKIRTYIDNIVINNFDKLSKNNLDIKAQMDEFENRLYNIKESQKELDKIHFSEQDIFYGILSLSMTWKNILLWSHYADCHKGFCIGLDKNKLCQLPNFGMGGPVEYPKNKLYPVIHPLDEKNNIENIFKETHKKSKEWSYEKEYRLVKNFYPHKPSIKDRLINIPDSFISELLLGLRISEEDKKQIINIAKQKNIKVYQIVSTPFKFEINRERIL